MSKQFFCFIIFTSLICCIFSSCSTVGSEISLSPSSQTTVQTENYEGSLYFANQHSGSGAAGENGYYDYNTSANGGVVIMYTDYTTKVRIPLCTAPNCQHNNESCTAWYEYTGGGMLPIVCNNKLVLAVNGASSVIKQDSENIKPHIEVMDLNGSNKKILFSLPNDLSFSKPFVLYDDGFYCLCSRTQLNADNQETISNYELIKFDIKNSTFSILSQIDAIASYLGGFTEDSLLIRIVDVNENEGGIPEERDSILKYNLLTNSSQEIFSWLPSEAAGYLINDNVYKIDKTGGELHQFNCTTEESNNLGAIYDPKNPPASILIKDIIDQKLIFEEIYVGENSTSTNYFSFDLSLLQRQDLTLKTNNTMHDMPLTILAETETQLLVTPSIQMSTVNVESVTGELLSIPWLSYDYALLSKSDYWANRPNYIKIQEIF